MAEWLLANAGTIYPLVLIGGFLAAAVWESARPLVTLKLPLGARWTANLGLLAIYQTLLSVLLPIAGVSAAIVAAERGWGLFNLVETSSVVAFVVGFVVIDLVRWGNHFALHAIEPLWRVHRVHHSDTEYDCTLAGRFHPLEALFTAVIFVGVIIVLGITPITVLVSQLIMLVHNYIGHGNVVLPDRLESLARKVVITPALHRIHHSARDGESRSNYGSLFSCWDRLFGTWCEAAEGGPEAMPVGLAGIRDPKKLTLLRLLWMPFTRSGDRRPKGEPVAGGSVG